MADFNEEELMALLETDPMTVIREVREEEAFRLMHEKFRYYEPNGACEQYIAEVGSDKRLVTLFSAANGVGKTAASVNILANIMYGKDNLDNHWFDHPLYREWPYPKRGRIVSEAANIEKNVIPSLEEWLPLGRYKAQKGTKSFLSKWETDNGWSFDIMTNDQDPAQFEGPTLGWIWCDEPPTETIYKACISRLRSGGVMFISATPLNGSAWMYDTIVAKKDKTADIDQMTQ